MTQHFFSASDVHF